MSTGNLLAGGSEKLAVAVVAGDDDFEAIAIGVFVEIKVDAIADSLQNPRPISFIEHFPVPFLVIEFIELGGVPAVKGLAIAFDVPFQLRLLGVGVAFPESNFGEGRFHIIFPNLGVGGLLCVESPFSEFGADAVLGDFLTGGRFPALSVFKQITCGVSPLPTDCNLAYIAAIPN